MQVIEQVAMGSPPEEEEEGGTGDQQPQQEGGEPSVVAVVGADPPALLAAIRTLEAQPAVQERRGPLANVLSLLYEKQVRR